MLIGLVHVALYFQRRYFGQAVASAPALEAAVAEAQNRAMAKAALANKGSGDRFYEEKLATARYYFERVLPDATSHLAKVKTGAGPVMALGADSF